MSSNKTPNIHTHSQDNHGSMATYVVGFILSLIFSLIPYFLVVNKTLSGTALVATILGFGVIQMIIQIFFFLHLGRGPKPLYNVVFFVATVCMILVVVVASVFIMDHLHYNMQPADITKKLAQKEGLDQVGGEKTGACQNRGANHKVHIKNNVATPSFTHAKLCDTLTFINEDDNTRKITFGAHPGHDSYGGESEIILTNKRSQSITFNQLGQHIFHDHDQPQTSGQFYVAE